MAILKELIAQREARFRKDNDFTKISITEMQKMSVPGGVVGSHAWNNILNGRIELQKEIDNLTFCDDFFGKFDTLSDADKRKMFANTDDGHMRLKNNDELEDVGIILSAAAAKEVL